jgi:hypothetical protein
MEGVVNYAMITWDNQYKHAITSAGFAFTDGAVQFLLIPGSFYESHDDALRTVLLYFKIDEWLEKIGSKDSRYWVSNFRLKVLPINAHDYMINIYPTRVITHPQNLH